MPPKPRAGLLKRPFDLADTLLLSCPSCSRSRFPPSSALHAKRISTRSSRQTPLNTQRRFTSNTSASASASVAAAPSHVNKYVPDRYQELYEALSRVRDVAAEHVDLARLQLVLRGLESEMAVVRVAVLGLDDTAVAVRLVRLILADPLSARAEWEDHLENYHLHDAQGLLIRYGMPSETPVTESSLPVISIPSIALRNANVEILISSISTTETSPLVDISSALETPMISIGSPGGHHTTVRYPVHKTIVCGNGVDGLLGYSKLARNLHGDNITPVHAAFNLNAEPTPKTISKTISIVDIERAELAIAKFRESVQHAAEYERGWTGSGVQPLTEWMVGRPQGSALRPEVRGLAQSVLKSAEMNLLEKEATELRRQEAESVSEGTRQALNTEVTTWAESAHTELRESLDDAFSHYKWRDLTWWKLFWRVDDVGMLSASILDKQWLRQAERGATWLGGRFQQAGLLSQNEPSVQKASIPDSISPAEGEIPSPLLGPKWPDTITQTRNQLLSTKVPSFHALAQSLVFYSVSTTTLTSALSILTYISTSSTSLYEAGTIAAIGLIYSLRRQQKRWDAARSYWESEVREEGRQTLKDTEDAMQIILRDGGRKTALVIDTEAREGIDRAKEALDHVK